MAEQEILKAATQEGILDQATTNAQTYLRWFFETLGYKQINFVAARTVNGYEPLVKKKLKAIRLQLFCFWFQSGCDIFGRIPIARCVLFPGAEFARLKCQCKHRSGKQW